MNLHIKKTHPSITIWKIDKTIDLPVVRQGDIRREYLDQTFNGHGYHCPPMTSSNVSGWEFLLPHDVTIIWDGISDSDPSHIKILNGEFYQGKKIVENVTGNATLRFLSNSIIQTDKDHYSLISGSPNYFFDGATPYEVILRTDHHYFAETFFAWRITKANIPITFPKGMPFMFIKNYPNDLLKSTKINVLDLEDNKTIKNEMTKTLKMGEDFYKNKKDWEWSGFYKKGINSQFPNGKNINIRPTLEEPNYDI